MGALGEQFDEKTFLTVLKALTVEDWMVHREKEARRNM